MAKQATTGSEPPYSYKKCVQTIPLLLLNLNKISDRRSYLLHMYQIIH